MDGSAYNSSPLTGASTMFKNALNKIRGSDSRLENVVSTLENSKSTHFFEFNFGDPSNKNNRSQVLPFEQPGKFDLNSTGTQTQINIPQSTISLCSGESNSFEAPLTHELSLSMITIKV